MDTLRTRWQESVTTFKSVISDYRTDEGGDAVALVKAVTALHDLYADCYTQRFPAQLDACAAGSEVLAAARADEESMSCFFTLRSALHTLEPGVYDDYHPEQDPALDARTIES